MLREDYKKKKIITPQFSPASLEEKIRKKAYYIWEAKGRPENIALDNWLEAEGELKKAKISL